MHYRIGEFARLGGISIKALRHYDGIGLLRPDRVDTRTRYRLYSPQQLQDLAGIRSLQQLGATLADIRRVIGGSSDIRGRKQLLERLRSRAQDSLIDTRRSLRWIEHALEESRSDEPEVAVSIKRLPCLRVASIRARLREYSDIEGLESELRRAISAPYAGSLTGTLWHRCAASGTIEGEPFVQVVRPVPRSGSYELKELPQATLASAWCQPTDEDAVRVYGAIDRWIHHRGYELAGPKREICVGKILEVQFPIRPA